MVLKWFFYIVSYMFIEDKIKENVEQNDVKEYRIYRNIKSVVREGGRTVGSGRVANIIE